MITFVLIEGAIQTYPLLVKFPFTVY